MTDWPWMLDGNAALLRKCIMLRCPPEHEIWAREEREETAQQKLRGLNSYELKLKMLGAF
jgi:hypothetical protein